VPRVEATPQLGMGLAFARKLPTRPEVIDTAGHLRRAADLFGPSLRGDIQVDLDLEGGLWPIRVDAASGSLWRGGGPARRRAKGHARSAPNPTL
jgi:hypothetical protein